MAQTKASSPPSSGWRAYRREISFLVLFVLLLAAGFSSISWNPVNDAVIEPFTAQIARASGAALNFMGQDVQRVGTQIRSPRFAVEIQNGCNGVETMVIFVAAVLAFPAVWPARLIGLVLGCVAIQVVNLLRVIALFLTGAYLPDFFNTSHTVLWQTIVILFGVLLWVFWAHRFAVTREAEPMR